MVWVKKYQRVPTMSLNSKYDDFGELVWKEPPRKPKTKNFNYKTAFKLLGVALM